MTFIIGNVALMTAWSLGWALNPFRGMPFVLYVFLIPCHIATLALVAVTTTDAVLRGLARERMSGWPIVIAVLGILTTGISSFAYYLGWGRMPITDAEDGEQ